MLDLETHFAFYKAYHNNPVNILIHTILIWPILFSFLLIFNFSPTLFLSDDLSRLAAPLLRPALVLNLGSFIALFYTFLYVALDAKAGSLGALLCLVCWVGACHLGHALGCSLAWKVFLATQLFCWTGQVIGHGVFEKRAPAHNLLQAFLMVPFFVLLHLLQTCFRYEPYPGFHETVTAKIQEELKEWKEKNDQKNKTS